MGWQGGVAAGAVRGDKPVVEQPCSIVVVGAVAPAQLIPLLHVADGLDGQLLLALQRGGMEHGVSKSAWTVVMTLFSTLQFKFYI